jgi:hypothetical protein
MLLAAATAHAPEATLLLEWRRRLDDMTHRIFQKKESPNRELFVMIQRTSTQARSIGQLVALDPTQIDVIAVPRYFRAGDRDGDSARCDRRRETKLELHLDITHDARLHIDDDVTHATGAMTVLGDDEPAPDVGLSRSNAMLPQACQAPHGRRGDERWSSHMYLLR